MKLLFFVYVFSFVSFAEAQTAKIVARKACEVVEKCSDVDHFTGPDRGLVWGGITIYDWGDHDNNPATLDTLGWSQCAKATVQNSGADSTVTEDNCTCNCPYERNHADCVGEETCTCTLKTCPSGETLNTSTCVCEPTCSLSCTGNLTLNRDTCTCECTRDTLLEPCPNRRTLNRDTCNCECDRDRLRPICPINRLGYFDSINCRCTGDDCSIDCSSEPYKTRRTSGCECGCPTGSRSCENSGNRYDSNTCSCYPIVTCSSDSQCGDCQRCNSSGQCQNNTTSWTPTWTRSQHCTTERKDQTRCVNGVERTRTLTGTKTTGNCASCTPESSSESRPCPVGTGTQTRTKTKGCTNGVKDTNWTYGEWTGECVPDECSSDSDCGDCQRCHQSTRTCVNKTTSWIPTWTRSQHCPDVSQDQTRCLNGVEELRTLTGTKTIGCGPECSLTQEDCDDGYILNPQRCLCTRNSCTPPNTACPNSTGNQRIYDAGSGTLINGICTGGTFTLKNCPCVDDPCTPKNKPCPDGQQGTQTGVRNSGLYLCDEDGLVNRDECTGGSWDKSDCRIIPPPPPKKCTPEDKPCPEGQTGTQTGNPNSGTIKDGQCTGGSWDDSNCTSSCLEEICTPQKTCGVVLILGQANSGTKECVDGVLSEECTGGNNLNGTAWIPECPDLPDDDEEECVCPQDRCWTVSENNDMCLWEGGLGCGPPPTIQRVQCQPR